MIIKTKALEIGKFYFKTHLNIYVSISFQMFFWPWKSWIKKIVSLKKVIHFCVVYALYINDIDQDMVKSNYIQNIIVNWVWKM